MRYNYKRIFPAIPLCIFISFSLLSQSVFDDYEHEVIKKNHVKKKTLWVYGASASSGYKSKEVTYNGNGDITEEISYRSNGKVSVKRNYKYDSNGNVIEYQSFDGQLGKITYKKFIKYDTEGKKMVEAGFDGVDRFDNKYRYDSKGRIQEIRYYMSDNLIERREITYTGNMQEVTVYKANNSISEKIQNYYDNNNNLIKDITLLSTGSEAKKIIYEYNSSGKKVKEEFYYSGNLTETKTYIYEGDKLVKIYIQKPDESKYLDRTYSYDSSGRISLEKWIDKRTGKYSTKSFKYDAKGNAIEINSFFALYNFKEDVKITYNFF